MSVLNFPSVPSNGQIYEGYIWVASESVWNLLPIDSAQGFTQLAGVDITSPSVGDALVYDGTDWVNQVPATPDALTRADLPAGSVLQVVRATDATGRTTTSNTFTDAGLSVSITPTSSTSAIQVVHLAQVNLSRPSGQAFGFLRIVTAAGIAISGAETQTFAVFSSFQIPSYVAGWHLPGSTDSVTYKVQFRVGGSTGEEMSFVNSSRTGQLFAIEVAV